MATPPSIRLTLKGDQGKSAPYTFSSSDSKRQLFRENQADDFVLPSKFYVGAIRNISLSSDDPIDKWFVESMSIRDIKTGQVQRLSVFTKVHTFSSLELQCSHFYIDRF